MNGCVQLVTLNEMCMLSNEISGFIKVHVHMPLSSSVDRKTDTDSGISAPVTTSQVLELCRRLTEEAAKSRIV